MNTVGVLDFVKRQTPESRHDHFAETWEELIQLVMANWEYRQVSPHNSGVLLVPMPALVLHLFYSSTVKINSETTLHARFLPRVSGEAPFIQVTAAGNVKTIAKHVEIILYSHETLTQDGDAPPTREADYYIVSINAYPTSEPSPMSPMTMARNFLGLKGGTKPQVPYSAEEFARSIVYWNAHVHVAGNAES